MKWVTSDFEQQWEHLCQSRPNYPRRFLPLLIRTTIDAGISHCVFIEISLCCRFPSQLPRFNVWSKLGEWVAETYFMSGPERRWGLCACAGLHRIRISDEDSRGETADANHDSDTIVPSLFLTNDRIQNRFTPRRTYFKNTQERVKWQIVGHYPQNSVSFLKRDSAPYILDPWEIVAWLGGAFICLGSGQCVRAVYWLITEDLSWWLEKSSG